MIRCWNEFLKLLPYFQPSSSISAGGIFPKLRDELLFLQLIDSFLLVKHLFKGSPISTKRVITMNYATKRVFISNLPMRDLGCTGVPQGMACS